VRSRSACSSSSNSESGGDVVAVVRIGTIGWFGEDIVEFAGDAVDTVATAVVDVAEAAWDVLDEVPGVAEFGDGFRDLINGPLKDFANSAVGKIVLRALAGSAYAVGAGFLGPMIGAQLASAAFALPGLARGEDFWSAWFEESWYRAKTTADIVGPGVVEDLGFVREVERALNDLKALLPDYASLTAEEAASRLGISGMFDVQGLAKRLNVSDYAAAKARWALFPQFPVQPGSYDSVTGKLVIKRLGKRPTTTTENNLLAPVKMAVPLKLPASTVNVLAQMKNELALQSAKIVPIPKPSPLVSAFASRPDVVALTAALSGKKPEPIAVAASAPPPSASLKTVGDVALIGVVAAAAGTFAWWYLGTRRR